MLSAPRFLPFQAVEPRTPVDFAHARQTHDRIFVGEALRKFGIGRIDRADGKLMLTWPLWALAIRMGDGGSWTPLAGRITRERGLLQRAKFGSPRPSDSRSKSARLHRDALRPTAPSAVGRACALPCDSHTRGGRLPCDRQGRSARWRSSNPCDFLVHGGEPIVAGYLRQPRIWWAVQRVTYDI